MITKGCCCLIYPTSAHASVNTSMSNKSVEFVSLFMSCMLSDFGENRVTIASYVAQIINSKKSENAAASSQHKIHSLSVVFVRL